MSVVVSIEDLGGSQKQVKVAVPAPAVAAETDRVTAEYRQRARIPGFRKGKVPASLVRQRFGEDIEREVIERLVPRYWKQAEAESELDPLLAPEVGSVDFSFGSELTFVATVDLRPEFEVGNIDSFSLPDEPAALTDEDVETALLEFARSVADWKAADRAAARGDRVTATVTPKEAAETSAEETETPESEPQPEPEKTTFEVGDAHVWEELSLAVTGLTGGQSGDFEREFLEGAEIAKKKFRVRVEAVEERDLPELDDEFAKRYGRFDGLDDMRLGIRENMTRSRAEEHRRARRSAVVEQLLERHPFEVPKRVVREETQELLKEYATGLAQQGLDLEKAGIDWQRMGEEFTPQAEKRVRARLVLDGVAAKLGLGVSEEELEAALATLAKSQKRSSGTLRQELDKAGRLGALREQLLRDKTMKTLLGDEDAGAEPAVESKQTEAAAEPDQESEE